MKILGIGLGRKLAVNENGSSLKKVLNFACTVNKKGCKFAARFYWNSSEEQREKNKIIFLAGMKKGCRFAAAFRESKSS